MQYNELFLFFVTFPLLFLLGRVLPLLKIPKSFVLNIVFIASTLSLSSIVSDHLNTSLRLGIFGICILSLLVKNTYQRITFYKILRNHFILGLALLGQFDIISLQTMVILLSVLPIVDMKNESLRAMVNEIIWLFLFFAFLIINKVEILNNLDISEYFIVLFYFCGSLFLFNRKQDSASSLLLVFTFFYLSIKHLGILPELFQYFLLLLQFIFLMSYVKNGDVEDWLKSLVILGVLIGPSNIEYSLIQVLLLCLFLLLEFYETFEFKIIRNIEIILVSVLFILVVERADTMDSVVKVSTTLFLVAVIWRQINRAKSIAHFDHS